MGDQGLTLLAQKFVCIEFRFRMKHTLLCLFYHLWGYVCLPTPAITAGVTGDVFESTGQKQLWTPFYFNIMPILYPLLFKCILMYHLTQYHSEALEQINYLDILGLIGITEFS